MRWQPAADLFPFMDDAAAVELRENIRRNGVLEPIVFLDGAVLDGRNRYMAARELGIAYPRVEHEGENPLGFVIAKNLQRRHLSEAKRAMVAAKIANMWKGDDQHSRGEVGHICLNSIKPEPPSVTVADAAAMLK